MATKWLHSEKTKFQFLLGTLITEADFEMAVSDPGFQFLLGTLITLLQLRLPERIRKFQFLLGTLITGGIEKRNEGFM